MNCKKCGYSEKYPSKILGHTFCKICISFAPDSKEDLEKYIDEKIDWKILDTFRVHGKVRGQKQKGGMLLQANKGFLQARPPLGYDAINGNLVPNQDMVKVRSLFKTFLARNYSLNSLAKNFSLSVNGLKKVLTNRTYLGEIKFDGKIYKSNHKPIVNTEIFYAAQRKLKDYLNPRKPSD